MCCKHFGNTFFSLNDAKVIGHIREELDKALKGKSINKKEFYILLSSLLYSADRVANTVGHYDAYRKNVNVKDSFVFDLITPIKTDSKILIFKEDSNILANKLSQTIHNKKLIAYIDPPYNSRQYSRFYHLLETLTQNTKPKLYGVALKPEAQNLSKYCKIEAQEAFKDLISSLSKMSILMVVSYNNTYHSKSSSSQNKISLDFIQNLLSCYGKISLYEFDYKAFSSGKTNFHNHKEMLFVCEVG